MNQKLIGTSERKLLIAGSILIVLLSLLPTFAGFLTQTPEMRFNGAVFDWPDIAVHLMAIRSGMEGNWRFTLFFTPVPQQGHFIKLFYIAMGNLFRATKATPIMIYYISLAVFNMGACLVLYQFIAEFIDKAKYRATAFLLAIFGSGLGWFMHSFNLIPQASYTPIDLWLIDAYPYFSMIVFPHFSAVVIGQLGFILLYLRYRETSRVIYPLGMAAIGLLLQAIQSFAPMIPFLVVGGLILGEWITKKTFPQKQVFAVGLIGLVQIPMLTYNIFVFTNDPIWAAFAGQNQTLSPPPVYYLWGFFWFWLLLIPAAFKPRIFLQYKRISLLVWVIGTLALAYLPWAFQRRFLLYYTIPLSILVTIVLQEIVSPWLDRQIPFLARWKMALLSILVICVSFSNIYLIYARVGNTLPQFKSSQFHPAEINRALAWLKTHTRPNSIMISTAETGLLAGVLADQTVYVAHQFETAGYYNRVAEVEKFFRNEVELSDLNQPEIEWIFYGTYERELHPDFQPPQNFKIAYDIDGVTIYQREGMP